MCRPQVITWQYIGMRNLFGVNAILSLCNEPILTCLMSIISYLFTLIDSHWLNSWKMNLWTGNNFIILKLTLQKPCSFTWYCWITSNLGVRLSRQKAQSGELIYPICRQLPTTWVTSSQWKTDASLQGTDLLFVFFQQLCVDDITKYASGKYQGFANIRVNKECLLIWPKSLNFVHILAVNQSC